MGILSRRLLIASLRSLLVMMFNTFSEKNSIRNTDGIPVNTAAPVIINWRLVLKTVSTMPV